MYLSIHNEDDESRYTCELFENEDIEQSNQWCNQFSEHFSSIGCTNTHLINIALSRL